MDVMIRIIPNKVLALSIGTVSKSKHSTTVVTLDADLLLTGSTYLQREYSSTGTKYIVEIINLRGNSVLFSVINA